MTSPLEQQIAAMRGGFNKHRPSAPPVDMVNHPPHYDGPELVLKTGVGTNGDGGTWVPRRPKLVHDGSRMLLRLTCIDVIRWIPDVRLATAIKYVWRVAFGGKSDDREDIEKAIWYLKDWLDNPVDHDEHPVDHDERA